MTRRFSLLVDDRPETLLRVTGLCLRRRADVVGLRYGRSAHRGWARIDLELEVDERHGRGPGRAAGRARRGPRRGRVARVARLHWQGMDDVYELFQNGTALLESGDFQAAIVPLKKAAAMEPEKTSVREALGRAYFRSRHFEEAVVEFQAVVERAPTNDYALFCLGRALMECGRPADARKPLVLAANLRPDRRDYRIYRDRARAATA